MPAVYNRSAYFMREQCHGRVFVNRKCLGEGVVPNEHYDWPKTSHKALRQTKMASEAKRKRYHQQRSLVDFFGREKKTVTESEAPSQGVSASFNPSSELDQQIQDDELQKSSDKQAELHNTESLQELPHKPSLPPTGRPDQQQSQQPKSSHGPSARPVSLEETMRNFAEVFPSVFTDNMDKVHHKLLCDSRNCSSLSQSESKLMKQKTDKFQHTWLSDSHLSFCEKSGYWWLMYIEGEGIFCLLCRKHGAKSTQNKQNEFFGALPATRYKKGTVLCHLNSKKHNGALASELTNRVSVFQKELNERESFHEQVLGKVFHSLYWLAKEDIAVRKIHSLLTLARDCLDVKELKHFHHRSPASLREMLVTVGKTLESELVERIKSSGFKYGILVDDVSDIAVQEQMVVFVNYHNRKEAATKTEFLMSRNILEDNTSANAKALHQVLTSGLEDVGLEVQSMSGLVTDGAAVMVGKKSGLATLLKERNPSLISVHCVCHKLALACTDSNIELRYIKEIEGQLTQLWKLFHYSPKNLAVLMKCQLEMRSMKLSKKGTRVVRKVLKKACQTRWLSFNNAVQAVYEDIVPILHALKILDSDATACGLYKKMRSVKFVGTIFLLQTILPLLANLSKAFQKGQVHFSNIVPAISETKDKLKALLETPAIIDRFTDELKQGGKLEWLDLSASDHQLEELHRIQSKYIQALVTNIDLRFSQAPILEACSVFDPLCLPPRQSAAFLVYGNENIALLADHFSPGDEPEKNQLLAEFGSFKYNLMKWKEEYQQQEMSQSSMEWCLNRFVQGTFNFIFPSLVKVAGAVATIPVSNAWPERGASRLKIIKTRLRSRLKSDILQALMQISINGPEPGSIACADLMKKCVSSWLMPKARRNLPKRPRQFEQQQQQVSVPAVVVAEAGTQTNLASEHSEMEVNMALHVLNLSKKLFSKQGYEDEVLDPDGDGDDSDDDFDFEAAECDDVLC